MEYDRLSNLLIESADIPADISADRYLLNFSISAYLQICRKSVSADISAKINIKMLQYGILVCIYI